MAVVRRLVQCVQKCKYPVFARCVVGCSFSSDFLLASSFATSWGPLVIVTLISGFRCVVRSDRVFAVMMLTVLLLLSGKRCTLFPEVFSN